MLDKRRIRTLSALSDKIGIRFSDLILFHQALIHTSYANEYKGVDIVDNERLEFLGDAVLDLVISDYLYRYFPRLPEGELTKARATIVCEQTLAQHAVKLGIGEHLLLGKGELSSGGRERVSILADAFEAVIGAIYLDAGFNCVFEFILKHFQRDLLMVERGEYNNDYKTILQERVQKNTDGKVQYEVVSERGPDHDKLFEVAVSVNGRRLGIGAGKTKKESEQNAAKQALGELHTLHTS
ncbi:ribonuclease III [Acetonema longum]|uniref:Ribonuclease 3 n=1 Tax=Acetonema longum DSM 6540 TaxID=1009370 RepID=F7NFN3_9FIRM|nr:ribonuclease III [Acetonema longum]EGO65156.1 ribonuclease III [Acetonema longum DSM 6540]